MYQTYSTNGRLPEPAVTEKATRRKFSAEYKLRILAEAEGSTERGQIRALLRREGLARPLAWSATRRFGTRVNRRGTRSGAHMPPIAALSLRRILCPRSTVTDNPNSPSYSRLDRFGAAAGCGKSSHHHSGFNWMYSRTCASTLSFRTILS